MEIIVLSGLAYLGHKLSKDKVRNEIPEEKVRKQCNRYPFKHDNINMEKDIGKIPIEKGEEQLNHKIGSSPYQATQDYWSLSAFGDESDHYQPQYMALDPGVSEQPTTLHKKQAFHNNMVPYFSSGKKQNTNDALKERRLESFTGVDNVDYQKKKELTSPLFKPTKNVGNIHGNRVQSDKERLQRYEVSGKMHNVSPVEKVYVGPGLNLDPHEVARGGYHDTFRILPDNVNSYKKQTFAGRVIPGKGINTERNFQPKEMAINKPKIEYTLNHRPTMAQTNPYKNGRVKQNFHMPDTVRSRTASEHPINLAGAAMTANAHKLTNEEYYLQKDDNNCTKHTVGPSTTHGRGGYTVSKFLTHDTDRESCGVVTNVHMKSGNVFYNNNAPEPTLRDTTQHNNTGGSNVHMKVNIKRNDTIRGYKPGTTLRDTTQDNTYGGGHVNNSAMNAGGHTASNFVADSTHRESTSVQYGGTARGVDTQGSRDQYKADVTHRETTSVAYGGVAISSTTKAPIDHMSTDNAQPYHKREDTIIGYMPGPQGINKLKNPEELLENAEFKMDNNAGIVSAPKLPTKIVEYKNLGEMDGVNKVNEVNNRLDFGIQVNNPLVKMPVQFQPTNQR